MHPKTIQRVMGMLLVFAGLLMIVPAIIGLVAGDGSAKAFLDSLLYLSIAGLLVWFPVRSYRQELGNKDGFLIVVSSWLLLGLGGAIPLLLLEVPHMSLADAVFESISGLTTTGATVVTGLDELPLSFLFYRQQLQWLGGMGIIVLAVAILPMLRIGGMQLFRAETPGPMKDNKLTPRITETAKALWYIYLGLTLLCALAYYLAGMSGFDAIGHAFSTIAIGGFSTHDASLAYFDSPLIETIAVIFMIFAGMNFALHFMAWRKASASAYLQDEEVTAYILLLLVLAVVCSAGLYFSGEKDSLSAAIRFGVFQAVSAATTTGFTTDSFYLWPGALPLMLIMISFVGGCSGSTAGGMKVVRILLIYKQGLREIRRLIHPNASLPIKMGGRPMSEDVVHAIWGFFALYVASFCVLSLAVSATGLDLTTAVSAVAACINNLGPALGDAGSNFADLPVTAKWLLGFAMLLGRLEVFTLLVLFTPDFWRY